MLLYLSFSLTSKIFSSSIFQIWRLIILHLNCTKNHMPKKKKKPPLGRNIGYDWEGITDWRCIEDSTSSSPSLYRHTMEFRTHYPQISALASCFKLKESEKWQVQKGLSDLLFSPEPRLITLMWEVSPQNPEERITIIPKYGRTWRGMWMDRAC